MRRTLFLLLLCVMGCQLRAQRITRQYNNVSMSEALKELNRLQDKFVINFIYDDLEDFKVTTHVRNLPLPDALQQLIGFYPIQVVRKDSILLVECTHKAQRHLTGKIIDEHGEPMPFVNVLLLSTADSSIIAGGVSNEAGVFVVPYEPSQVLAKFSYVGYTTLYHVFSDENAGTIRLYPETKTLQAVKVTGYRPQYKMAKGGMTIDVENSVLSSVGTAKDVLGLLPRVNIDSQDNISVFAKGTPEVYINNRLVRNSQDLSDLKSTDIKSVDVITSPGAQYNATVKSVIRIHTKAKKGDGFSFQTDNNVKYNRYFSGFHEDYLKYCKNGLELFAGGYFSSLTYYEDNHIWQNMQGADNIYVDQKLFSSSRNNSLHGRFGGSYEFNEDNSIGVSYTIDKSLNGKGYVKDGTQNLYRNDILEGSVVQNMDIYESFGPSHEVNAYYIGKYEKLKIDLNASYIWKKNSERLFETERSTMLQDRDVHTLNKQRNRMLAGKLIFSYPIGKGNASWGTEVSNTYSKGEYINEEGYVSASHTEIKENNTAGFAEYDITLGRWSLNGGVRYEYVKSDYFSFGQREDSPSRRYGNWFPSFSVSWQKDKLGMQMSYSYKTTRPDYNSLRDEVQYDNRYFYEGGNPYLVPTLIHSLNLSINYSWLNASAGYTYNKHDILWSVTLYKNQDIGFSRNLNFDHRQTAYASVVASPKFGWYQPTFELDYSQQFFDAKKYGASRNLNHPNFTFSIQNRFVLPHDFSALLNITHNTNRHDGFIRNSHTSNLRVQLIKSFRNKTWTINLRVNDLLKTQGETFTMYGIQAIVGKDSYNYTRMLLLTVTYNFNTTRSKYKGTGAGNEERKRL